MRGDTEGSTRVDKITDVAGRVLEVDEADPVQGVVSVVHLGAPTCLPTCLPLTERLAVPGLSPEIVVEADLGSGRG
jgi:hypothetical protein